MRNSGKLPLALALEDGLGLDDIFLEVWIRCDNLPRFGRVGWMSLQIHCRTP
jgi:hypothetical protein